MLETAGIPHRRQQRVRRALMAQHLGPYPIAAGWLLRLSPGASAWSQARHAGLARHFITFLGAYTIQHLLFLLPWWVIGRAALQERLESGWQLSHGERSRLYLARALLQNARVVILDESFAALDPENLRHALQVACRRAPALLVIAHP